MDSKYAYLEFARINSGKVVYYQGRSTNRKGKTICVNADHGTIGGSSIRILFHGSLNTDAKSTTIVAGVMTFAYETPEKNVTL